MIYTVEGGRCTKDKLMIWFLGTALLLKFLTQTLPFSAGTGRTGAFIGIMNSLDRLINKEDLDMLGLVGSLRQQRRKMVFTNVSTEY